MTDTVVSTPASTPDPSRRSMLPWALLAVAVVAVLVLVLARSAPDNSDEARANRLAQELRCPECQGLSVADSFESTSEAIRADIARRIDEGESDGEIRQAYVDRYGENILLRPQSDGIGVLAWGIPVAVLVLGAGGVVFAVRRWTRGGEPVEQEAGRERPSARRWLTVGGLVVFALVAAFAASSGEGERRSGQTATGTDAAQTPSGADSEQTLRDNAAANPDDYAARIALARYLLNNDPRDALEEFDAAARLDPTQPEPLTYGGWIVGLVAKQVDDPGDRELLVDRSLSRLDAAIALDPAYEDSYVFRGLVLFDLRNDPAGAVPMFQQFLALAPEDHPMRALVLGALARAVEASGGDPTATTTPEEP